MDDNQYKVELGIKLNTSDLKTEIAQIDGKHKVKLGVDLGVKDIQDRIRQYNQNTNNIKVKLKATLDTDDLKKQIGKLNLGVGGKGLAVPVNTESLENSLREVSTIIKDIRNSLGTIDDKSDMKSLVVSINQIANALEKATNESDGLAASLKALSQKDFNVNFGIKLGGDSFTNNALYGNEMRNNVIPKLKKQIDAMVREYNKQMGASADENEALLNLAIGTKFATPDFLQGFYTPSSNTLQGRMANDKNLKEQAHALREYINLFQQVAKLKGLNLDSVISDFSETPNELIKGAEKIKTGMSQTTDSIERLKSVFSTGLDVEGLSGILQPLLEDIKAIRESIEGLSKGFSIDSITDSFREMSGILDTLTKNLNVFKDVLGSIGEGLGVSVEGDARQAAESANSVVQNEERKQQAIKQTQKLISDSAQQSIDKVSSQSINEFFKVDTTDSAKFKQEMENLVSQWTDAKGKLTDIKITTTTVFDEDTQQYIEQIRQAQVTYNNELGETIKKTIALRKIGDDDGNPIMGFAETAGSYSKSLGQTTAQTNRFVKQQKNAVSDLTNTINQLNRAAIDQNAARPIKDTSHLDELKLKYNEVVSAIQRMENASDDNTFQEERNNVKRLITEYKSLRDEYKNAENTATSLRSKDISTAKSTYASELDVLISKMKSSGIYNAGFEKGAENLRSILSSATDTSGLNKFSNGLDKLEAGYKRAAAAVNEFNRSQKVGINTSGLQSKIADIQRISPEINQFEAEVDGAKVSVQSLLNDLSKVKTQGDFSVVNSRFKAFADAAKAAGIAVAETATKTKSINEIKAKLKDTGFNGFRAEIDRAKASAEKLNGTYPELTSALRQLKVAFNEVDAANQANDISKLYVANEKYEATLKQVYSQLKLNQQAEKDIASAKKLSQDRNSLNLQMENWLRDNTRAAKDFGDEIRRLQSSLKNLDADGIKDAGRQFNVIKNQAKSFGKTGLTVFDQLKNKIKEYSVYFSAAELFMWAEQGLRSMFEQVKLIDSAMTELKKVTDETEASYEKFLTNAANRARDIGTTIDGLVSSTADFARLGYGFEDAQGLAEVANIYAVVGDEIEGVEGATESLISTMAAFKDQADGMGNSDFAMSIVDKFNEIGNNFAISSGGIGEALERSASSLDAANNTLDESIALITASNQVVQDPAAVGQALKTISMRIRGAKTEMEEAGLETDGMVESTAKLREEIMALSGVDIMENANEFKSTYKIMDELAAKWEDLSDIQQASITELIAGKRQGNIVSSLMSNFDTARDALETSLNSSGSAMREHEKWQQSLEAQINSLKASWQGLSQAFLSSDFLKVAFNSIIDLVDGLTWLIDKAGALPTLLGTIAAGFSAFKNVGLFEFKKETQSIQLFGTQLTNLTGKYTQIQTAINRYNSLSSKSTSFQQKYQKAMANSSSSMGKYLSGLNGAKASFSGYIGSLVGATVKTIALEAATIALNAALTMGISFAIQLVVEGIMKLVNAKKDLAEKVEELTSKFKEQHEELTKLKGDYDTTNETSMISKYEKLSKGVDNLGRNVSLTADEYSEYQDIVNTIADQIPSLVSGYDSQGNALLSCKDNVEELTAAYEKLIHAQNQEILTNSGKIEKDFKNQSKDADFGFWEDVWEDTPIVNWFTSDDLNSDTVKELNEYLNGNATVLDFDPRQRDEIKKALKDANVKVEWWDDGLGALEKTLKNDPEKIKGIIDKFYSQFDEAVEEQKTLAQAKLSEAFDISSTISGLDYGNISEDLQNVARQVVNSLDKDFFDNLQAEGISVEDWTKDMLDQLKAISKEDGSKISAAFDLQTQFNGGEISYGEYVKSLENTGNLIDGLDLDEEIESQLKLSIGLDEDGLVAEYQRLRKRLASDEHFNIMPSAYVSFIESLSSEELSVLWDVIPKLEATEYKEDIADIKAALEKEMMLQGLTFDLNLEVEAAGLEALNTALTESVSATGLSSESIAALKGRYADLESQGYDLSSMFEETSTGIRLNRQEFNKLENAYATDKLAEVDSELTEMKSTYDDLGEAIKNCDDPIRKSELFNERQTLAKRISEAATLAHQYKGLTNAYNDWLKAEESGQERDMYENIIKGWETIDDEISRGWIDDGAIEFLELLTGRTDLAGKSGKQLKEIYDGLDNTIKNTTYSVRDFFTVDEDGNSTNAGVYNFLDAIGQLEEEKFGGKDVVKRDKDGNVIGFDFELAGGDEVIAEALGVSEELVQIMVRAADDAGFVISMDGTYKQLADLQNEAKAAADYLHQIGKTDFEFDFNTSSVENLKTQLEEAHKILDDKKFWNKDGTFNFNADGATQAMQVVSTLQAKLDKLTEEQYGIGLTVEDEEFEEPLENLQEYGRTVQTLNQLKLNPKVNADKIEELEGNLDNIAKYFAGLDGDLKIDLGLDADDNWEDVKKKIENGEVTIPTVLDIQANMDKNIETLADLALLNSGLLSEDEEKVIEKKYKIEAKADKVDTSDIDTKVDKAVSGSRGGRIGSNLIREQNIRIIAETFGIEDVEGLSSELEVLDDKTIIAIAKAVGEGDVNALQFAVKDLDDKTIDAVCNALGYNDVETLKAAVNNMQGNEVDAKVNTEGQAEKVWSLQSVIDGLKGTAVNITLGIKKAASSLWGFVTGNKGSTRNDSNGFSEVNGTANVNGTTGKAFKQGSWGTKNSGTALVGELGREVLVRDGRYYTIGDNGAEFIKYKKDDIIFNHVQTKQLFANGKVTANGGRGKAFAEGTAFSSGSGGIGKVTITAKNDEKKAVVKIDGDVQSEKPKTRTNYKLAQSGSKGNIGGNDGDGNTKVNGSAVGTEKETEKFKETWDWVAIAIERVEKEIDNLDQKVGNVYQSWGSRNASLTDEISKVGKEIDLQVSAAKAYLGKAKSVGLTEKDSSGRSYAELIQEGALSIEDFEGEGNEALVEKIKEYQKWYDLYLGCVDAVNELQETESKLYEQRFENVQSQYDGILQGFEHTESMLNEYISQAEAKGYIVSEKHYNALIANEKQNIDTLKQEQAALIKARDEAVASGKIKEGSEAWYNMCAEIDGVTQEIESGTTALIEYANAIRDIDWQIFDLIQERISDVTAEANFLIDLMSNEKLFDDNGKMTDKGLATMGLHGQNYNTYMYQADEYKKEIAELDKQLKSDPYDQELINRRRELLELQRESILNAEQEKQSIKDLVEEGINLELDALQERIDLHNEELDSMRDLYDYQKNVQEQSEEIAALEKQRAAYLNDDSAESKAKLQEITVSLKEAKENLQETEYDRYISDQSALLDSLYEEYELILNERLDNVDALLSDMIAEINASASTISTTLTAEVTNVGATLSEAMKDIWNTDGAATKIVGMYGNKLTTVNTTLDNIKYAVNKMAGISNEEAKDNIEEPKAQPSSVADPTKSNIDKNENKNNNDNPSSSTGDGKPKVGDKVKFVSGKYYYDSYGRKPIGSKNQGKYVYITNINTKGSYPYHISTGKTLGSGNLGWLKLNQISGYASGKKNFLNNEIAWTQEKGEEFIIRPSDGAILTPVAKGDSILNAAASGNIWSMANNPSEFIKNNLKLDANSVPSAANVQSNITQNFENITFSMPNVHGYNELLKEMQKDPKFEKLVLALTLDQVAGKSALAKGKSIR